MGQSQQGDISKLIKEPGADSVLLVESGNFIINYDAGENIVESKITIGPKLLLK